MLAVFLPVLFACSCSYAVACLGPVTYQSGGFTIKGPCPNDVVIAPVGDTVQYRCDYLFGFAIAYQPYWSVIDLPDSPYVFTKGSYHAQVYVTNFFRGSKGKGHTTCSITVLQQYLNNILSLRCGLCSPNVCSNHNKETLSESITSTKVDLVSFGTPSPLNQFVVGDTLSLSWSPPPISVGYTDPIDFQYKVTLINVMNTSQVLQFTTNNTHLNISQLLVPDDHDICSRYWWNVSAIVEERESKAVQSNESISILSGPFILSEDIRTNITKCRESVFISADFRVISCPDAGDLQHDISFKDDTTDQTIKSDSSLELLSENSFFLKSVITVLKHEEVLNGTITVNVSNKLGSKTTYYKLYDTVDTCDEDVTPSTTTSNAMSSSVISSLIDSHHTSTASASLIQLVVKPSSTDDSGIAYITVGIVVALLLIAIITITCAIIGLKIHKRRTILFAISSVGSKESKQSHYEKDSPIYESLETTCSQVLHMKETIYSSISSLHDQTTPTKLEGLGYSEIKNESNKTSENSSNKPHNGTSQHTDAEVSSGYYETVHADPESPMTTSCNPAYYSYPEVCSIPTVGSTDPCSSVEKKSENTRDIIATKTEGIKLNEAGNRLDLPLSFKVKNADVSLQRNNAYEFSTDPESPMTTSCNPAYYSYTEVCSIPTIGSTDPSSNVDKKSEKTSDIHVTETEGTKLKETGNHLDLPLTFQVKDADVSLQHNNAYEFSADPESPMTTSCNPAYYSYPEVCSIPTVGSTDPSSTVEKKSEKTNDIHVTETEGTKLNEFGNHPLPLKVKDADVSLQHNNAYEFGSVLQVTGEHSIPLQQNGAYVMVETSQDN